MREAYRALLSVHVALGAVALFTFWIALFARKGSRVHRRAGRVFAVALAASVATALPLCAAVQVFDPLRIRPPEPGLSPGELAAYPHFIRHLFREIAGAGLFAWLALWRGLRALRRRRLVAHVAWILSAGVTAHTAFFVSVLPKLLPGVYSRNPAENPLPWLLPPLVGALGVVLASRAAARRYGPRPPLAPARRPAQGHARHPA
jgi:uncharacterized membrane protein YozB (DUF420 family)